MRFFRARASRTYLLLSVAFGMLALFSAMGLFHNLVNGSDKWGKLARVLVAARDLQPGEILDATAFTWTELPEKLIPKGVATDPGQVHGKRLISGLREGDPIFTSLFDPAVRTMDNLVLPRGVCAFPLSSQYVSLPIREMRPGQRLDIIAVGESEASILLEDVEVIALSLPSREHESGSFANEGHVFLKLTDEEACLLARALRRGQVEAVISGVAPN